LITSARGLAAYLSKRNEEFLITPRTQLRIVTAFVFVAAICTAAITGSIQGAPSLSVLALFGALVVYGELKAVEAGSIVISPGWMILTATIVAFEQTTPLLGPMLVGMAAAVHVPHFRERNWQMLAFNSGMLGMSTFAAAVAFSALPNHLTQKLPGALVAPIVATAAFVVVLWPMLAVLYIIRERAGIREILSEFVPATAQWVSFSLIGFLVGRLYVDLGAGVVLLIIVPILTAREMFASYMRVKESHEETVHMLIHALEQKDHYTAGHAERVSNYARYIGEELAFMPARMERLRFAALMHDIGKLVVPNHILNKPGRLTPAEYERVRMHEKVGVQMLSHIDFLRPIAPTTHADAMRFDPDDLDHPIEPYIVMIADAYDAMTSTRAYRKALSQDVAFQELRDKAGVQFHPACVEALVAAIEKRGEKHGAGYEEQTEFTAAPDTGLGSAGLGDLLHQETA
jgi:hypothetical protein